MGLGDLDPGLPLHLVDLVRGRLGIGDGLRDLGGPVQDRAELTLLNVEQLLPRSPHEVLGGLMTSVADGEISAACALFTGPAEAKLVAALDAPDCAAAVIAWHARVTRPADYGLSNRLLGDTSTCPRTGRPPPSAGAG